MRRISRSGGFTLLEIVFSIGLLAIICVFVLNMFAHSLNTEDKARDIDNAVSKAGTAVEMLKTYTQAELESASGLIGQGYTLLPGRDGSFKMEMYFDGGWKSSPAQNPDGFTVFAYGEQPDGDGVQTINVSVVKHSPYRLEDSADAEIYSLEAARYDGQGPADTDEQAVTGND